MTGFGYRYYCSKCEKTFEAEGGDDPYHTYYRDVCPYCNSSLYTERVS